jgi:hypothetical protein
MYIYHPIFIAMEEWGANINITFGWDGWDKY